MKFNFALIKNEQLYGDACNVHMYALNAAKTNKNDDAMITVGIQSKKTICAQPVETMTAFNFAEYRKVDENSIYLMSGLLLVVFMPTSLFFSYQLFKRRGNITISKRYPVITFCLSIFLSLRLIISAVIMLLLTLDTMEIESILYKLLLVIDNIFLYLFFLFLLWRMWNINCDLQWINNAIKDEQWRTMIALTDDAVIAYGNKRSWYLRTNHTFGKSSFCGKIFVPLFFVIFFCLSCVPILASAEFYDDKSTAALVSRLAFIILMLLFIILYIVTPKKVAGNKDGFFIAGELGIVFVFNVLIFCVSIAALVYGRAVYEIQVDGRRYVYLLIEESLYFALEWLIIMFSTFYVLGKTGEMFANYHLSRNRGKTDVQMIQRNSKVSTQLYQAMKKKEVFDAFIKFLAADFNLQSMLALIEFLQFQRYCQKYFIKNPVAYQTLLPENETLSLESDRIRLPDDLPQSDIVFANAETETQLDLQEFFGRTRYVALLSPVYTLCTCTWYIEPGCELQVPFSTATRQKYVDKMKDLNVWLFESPDVKNLYDMMHFLDTSIKDIYQLLSNSYNTFANAGIADEALLST